MGRDPLGVDAMTTWRPYFAADRDDAVIFADVDPVSAHDPRPLGDQLLLRALAQPELPLERHVDGRVVDDLAAGERPDARRELRLFEHHARETELLGPERRRQARRAGADDGEVHAPLRRALVRRECGGHVLGHLGALEDRVANERDPGEIAGDEHAAPVEALQGGVDAEPVGRARGEARAG